MIGFRTDALNTEEIWQEIEEIAAFFKTKGIQDVKITYGLSCNTSRLYEPIKLPVEGLLPYIQNSIHHGIYKLGHGELQILGGDPSMLFVICHAGDIHFESEEENAGLEVGQHWSAKGYLLHYYPA